MRHSPALLTTPEENPKLGIQEYSWKFKEHLVEKIKLRRVNIQMTNTVKIQL